jgi:hypothetical protein
MKQKTTETKQTNKKGGEKIW